MGHFEFMAQTARVQTNVAIAQTAQIRYAMYNQLASTYYALLLSQAIDTIYVRNLATTSTIIQHVADKYAKGLVSEEQLNRATIQQLQAGRTLAAIRTQYRQLSYDRSEIQMASGQIPVGVSCWVQVGLLLEDRTL